MSYIIVGLGNPGLAYEGTRHNTGRACVGYVATTMKATPWKVDKKLRVHAATLQHKKKKVLLLLPDTFMNASGASLKPLVKSKKQAEELIVIYDDLDLPFGTIRVAFDRGSGGHRGVESIIKTLKTKAFVRMRIGICPTTPGGKLKKPSDEEAVLAHILGKFSSKEQVKLKALHKLVHETLLVLLEEGREKAMGMANCR